MQKNIHIKFNYKKAVNNRYNYKIFTANKSLKVLHIVSKEQLKYKNYYTSGCFNNVMQDLQELDRADFVDYENYERWLDNGGRC